VSGSGNVERGIEHFPAAETSLLLRMPGLRGVLRLASLPTTAGARIARLDRFI